MRRTTALRTAALAAGLTVLTGCGIRGTAVPVDAGSAPSRAACVVRPGAQGTPPASGFATQSVHLVCSSQLLPVTRTLALPGDSADALTVARALLAELQRQPSPAEEEAGFTTDVPRQLAVDGPHKGDPAETLRLNRAPDELPPVGLAQLVCTYVGTAAADGRQVVLLGGPGGEAPKSYPCSDDTRTHPETVQSTGTSVS